MCANEVTSFSELSERQEAERFGVSVSGIPIFWKLLSTTFSIVIPMLGSIYALYYLVTHRIGWIEISSFFLFYAFVGMGIGVRFHRYLTHQGFVSSPFLKTTLLFAGSMAFQGAVIRWVSDHRRHHRFTDMPWDTHSPYYYKSRPIKSRLLGLIHAHVGWMFDPTATKYVVYAPDLLADREVLLFHYLYFPCCVASLLLPWLYGYFLGGPGVALGCLLLGGFLRIIVFHHTTWSLNSIGHFIGSQPSTRSDESRNNLALGLLLFGEGWHNNHHAQPRSAFHGWGQGEVDMNGAIIRFLEYCGLVKSIVRPVSVNESRPESNPGPNSSKEHE